MKTLTAGVLLLASLNANAGAVWTAVMHNGLYGAGANAFSVVVYSEEACEKVVQHYNGERHSSFSAECWDDAGNITYRVE